MSLPRKPPRTAVNEPRRSPVHFSWAALLLAACTPPPAPSGGDGVTFREVAADAGLAFVHTDGSSGKYYIVETLASGVILFDYDNDGDLDIYFPSGRPLPPTPEGDRTGTNALYENRGGLRFVDVTREKGVPGTGFGAGGAAGDYDGDGDLDLYVCQHGHNILYRNLGPERGYAFEPATEEAGCDDERFSAGAVFFDMDRDGDLDLYVTNYCFQDFVNHTPFTEKEGALRYRAPSEYAPQGDSLFRNEGEGKFTNATDSSGVGKVAPGRGMGVIATDYNLDGWLDLYIANDGSENFLFENQGNGTFKEVGLVAGVALSANGDETGSMGVDSADFDRDGDFDLICTNYQKQLNGLYRQDAAGIFTDTAMAQGLGETCLPMVSWGLKLFDYDNDGWLDLLIVNGHLEDHISQYDGSSTYLQPRQLFHNLGGGKFAEITAQAGPDLGTPHSSRGAAFGDLDNDGDIDVVVSNSRDRPSLYRNDGGNSKSWILLALRGQRNRFGVGALVRLTAGGVTQMLEVHAGSSYISQSDLRLHFGLAGALKAEKIEVRWPEGATEVFEELSTRQLHVLEEGRGKPVARSP